MQLTTLQLGKTHVSPISHTHTHTQSKRDKERGREGKGQDDKRKLCICKLWDPPSRQQWFDVMEQHAASLGMTSIKLTKSCPKR